MKIKYVVVCCVLFSLGSFLLNAIPKVKIEVRNGVPKIARAGSAISKKDLGGNEDAFKALVDFTKLVSKLRNDGEVYSVVRFNSYNSHTTYLPTILEKGKELLDRIYPDEHESVFLYPYEIGKTFNLRISNILIALADTKNKNFLYRQEKAMKSYISAALFAHMMKRVFKILKKGNKLESQFNNQAPCGQDSGNKNIYCGLMAKDHRENISDAAIRSGNFFFMYILDPLLQGDEQRFNRYIELFFNDFERFEAIYNGLHDIRIKALSRPANFNPVKLQKAVIDKELPQVDLHNKELFNAALKKFIESQK